MLDGNLIAGFGALAAVLAGAAFYLASPHRKVLVGRAVRAPALTAGILLTLASLPLLCAALDVLAATFAWATLLMLAMTIIPFLPLLWRTRG